jgi:hypothetical protein
MKYFNPLVENQAVGSHPEKQGLIMLIFVLLLLILEVFGVEIKGDKAVNGDLVGEVRCGVGRVEAAVDGVLERVVAVSAEENRELFSDLHFMDSNFEGPGVKQREISVLNVDVQVVSEVVVSCRFPNHNQRVAE